MIITIGRQFGSRGREIGKALASDYNIAYYDKELLPIAAQESGLDQNFLENYDEHGKNSLLYSIVYGYDQPLSYDTRKLFCRLSGKTSAI